MMRTMTTPAQLRRTYLDLLHALDAEGVVRFTASERGRYTVEVDGTSIGLRPAQVPGFARAARALHTAWKRKVLVYGPWEQDESGAVRVGVGAFTGGKRQFIALDDAYGFAAGAAAHTGKSLE